MNTSYDTATNLYKTFDDENYGHNRRSYAVSPVSTSVEAEQSTPSPEDRQVKGNVQNVRPLKRKNKARYYNVQNENEKFEEAPYSDLLFLSDIECDEVERVTVEIKLWKTIYRKSGNAKTLRKIQKCKFKKYEIERSQSNRGRAPR
jgi:hypothetical protein